MDLFRINPGFVALSPMFRRLKCVKHDSNEVNYAAGFFNLMAASLAVTALMYSDFILIDDAGGDIEHSNRTLLALDNFSSLNVAFVLEDSCERIGAYYFWRPARFGTYDDATGKQHVVYHYEDTTLVDCISPTVANLFYIMIALCFVIIITSSFGGMMNIIGPSYGFLQWLRQNTVLEICNMAICLITCIIALFAQLHIANLRPWSSISVSTGVFLIACSGLMSFLSSGAVLRSKALLQRARRIDNQRLLCHRSLRSWRDVNNRMEDTTPIIQFERYLMQSSVLPSDDSFEPNA
uniref:TMEM127 domain-containing protein n=1 Tax=Steinernema glaseri TaxID=37863 RepID=A0A1I8ARQ3_9BILA